MRCSALIITGMLWVLCASSGVLAQSGVSVQAVRLEEVLISLERKAPADVRPLNTSTIAAQVPAVIKAIHADIGQRVNAGDLLLELEETDFQLNLQQAQANLASSKAQKAQADVKLTRARELGENQYLSADALLARETDVMVIAAQIKSLEVSVAIARRNLDKCHITAPFNAVIDERYAQLGSYVINGTPLLNLTELDRFELDSEIASQIAESIEDAKSIHFESGGQSYPVSLERLSPAIDLERRTRRARFHFTDSAPPVGSSGEVIWYAKNGLMPASLVIRRSGVLGIFVVESGIARFVALPGAQEGRPSPVSLPMDAMIVVQGRDRLQDGDQVNTGR